MGNLIKINDNNVQETELVTNAYSIDNLYNEKAELEKLIASLEIQLSEAEESLKNLNIRLIRYQDELGIPLR